MEKIATDTGVCRYTYVNSARELAWLSETVRLGRSFEGEYICLTCDVDLSKYGKGEGWKPIGSALTPFAGVFDGRRYAIAGLSINRPSRDYQGLFGAVAGTVENIQLRDSQILGRDFTGAVAGCLNGGIIRNANVTGNVTGCHMVGGIVGNSICGVIDKDKFQGNVGGQNHIGGISGAAWRSDISDSLIISSTVSGRKCSGGIAGSLFGGALEGCRCTGQVNGHSLVGGIAGRTEDGSVIRCTAACYIRGQSRVGSVGGYACGKNVIDGCFMACNVFDGSRSQRGYRGPGLADDYD